MDTFENTEHTPEPELTRSREPEFLSWQEPESVPRESEPAEPVYTPPVQPEYTPPVQQEYVPPVRPEYAPPVQQTYTPRPAPEQPVQPPVYTQTGYRGTGTGRKESPYASSPYVMNHQPQSEYRYQPQTQPPVKPPKAKKQRKPIWKPLVAGLLAVLLVIGSCAVTAEIVTDYWEERNEDTVEQLNRQISDLQSQIDALSRQNTGASVSGSPAVPDGLTPSQVYAQNVRSVVAISCTVQSGGIYGSTQGTSTGSGFILSQDGYVLTNYHVVEGAVSIGVIMHDGQEYTAEVVGYDSSANDLAVLKVEAENLPAAKIGSSNDLIIGDMVVAIGNPLGELTSTQTVGYVSGIGREVATDSLTTIRMIQTDAAINPGNSGGPLFNMRGEVIGITTAKYSGTTTSGASIEGIGFAIPIDDVMDVIDDLINLGYVDGAYMGVSVQNTDEASASMFGLPTGAYIASVEKDGPAYKAGIQPKDIIIDVGGHKVSNVTDLTRALRHFKAGDTTTVTVIRSGQQKTLEITLAAKPQNTETAPVTPSMPSEGNYNDWFDFFFGG